jgi:hypothetical protein
MSVSTALVEASDALLCNTSRPPNDSTAVSTMRTTLGSSDTSTSATTALPSPPATRSAADPSMSATTTDAPSCAISRAVASPMPLPAPVTIATLPSRRPIGREYVTALSGLPGLAADAGSLNRFTFALHAAHAALTRVEQHPGNATALAGAPLRRPRVCAPERGRREGHRPRHRHASTTSASRDPRARREPKEICDQPSDGHHA